MSSLEKLGANIRALRKAYGETQEELGIALNVEKNTVSYYENGKRQPNQDMLTEIAKHFMVSVEELMYSDFSEIGSITIDYDVFLKNIGVFLPLALSDEAWKNEHFQKAYILHQNIYYELRKKRLDGIDQVDACFDEYLEAYKDETIKPEAAANILAIWFLMLLLIKTIPLAMKNRSAALIQMAAKDSKARLIIDNPNPDFEKEAQLATALFNDPEITKQINEMKTTVKHSRKWADLADYYLALQYIWNICNNEMSWEFNKRVGAEMLYAFVSVGNTYASRFLKLSQDSVELSSQNVDDR